MGLPKDTVPTPVAPKMASFPSDQIVGEAQLALLKSQRKFAEPLFQVFCAAWVCTGERAASIKPVARSVAYRFILRCLDVNVWASRIHRMKGLADFAIERKAKNM